MRNPLHDLVEGDHQLQREARYVDWNSIREGQRSSSLAGLYKVVNEIVVNTAVSKYSMSWVNSQFLSTP
jgi:hypothetical protein